MTWSRIFCLEIFCCPSIMFVLCSIQTLTNNLFLEQSARYHRQKRRREALEYTETEEQERKKKENKCEKQELNVYLWSVFTTVITCLETSTSSISAKLKSINNFPGPQLSHLKNSSQIRSSQTLNSYWNDLCIWLPGFCPKGFCIAAIILEKDLLRYQMVWLSLTTR